MMDKEYHNTYDLGLGDADTRRKTLHAKITCGIATDDEREEYRLLGEAMNSITLTVNMVCNIEDMQEQGIDIFTESAKTSCCRPSIKPKRTSRRK